MTTKTVPIIGRPPDSRPLLERLGLVAPPDAGPTREELFAKRARLLEQVAAGGRIAEELVKTRAAYADARAAALERVRAKFAPRIAELERQAVERDAARGELERVEQQLRDTAD